MYTNQPNNPPEPVNYYDQPRFTSNNQFGGAPPEPMKYDNTLSYGDNNNSYDGGVPEPGNNYFNNNNAPPEPGFRTFE